MEELASVRKRSGARYDRWVDADGVKQERKAGTNKRSAEQLADALEAEATRIRSGVVDPNARGFRDHEARPLADHLADYHAYLAGKGSTPDHAKLTRNRVARLTGLARA